MSTGDNAPQPSPQVRQQLETLQGAGQQALDTKRHLGQRAMVFKAVPLWDAASQAPITPGVGMSTPPGQMPMGFQKRAHKGVFSVADSPPWNGGGDPWASA